MATGQRGGVKSWVSMTIAVCAACSCSDGRSAEPLEVRVLVAERRVDVYTRKSGDCHELGEFRHESGCRSDAWRIAPINECVAQSCVSSLRLEHDGEVLERHDSPGRFAAFDLDEPLESGTTLVIEGCDQPISLELPTPKTQGEINISGTTEAIQVEVDTAAAGTFAFTSSLSVGQGFFAACESDGTMSNLPISEDFGFYAAGAFAFDGPEVIDDDRVHAELFPSLYMETSVSTQVALDPLWEAAEALAQNSSLYESCTDYCDAAQEACGGNGDSASCSTQCVGVGEAFRGCSSEYASRIECWAVAPECTTNPREPENSEESPCAAEDAAWTACAQGAP